jgi:hypothetical protein
MKLTDPRKQKAGSSSLSASTTITIPDDAAITTIQVAGCKLPHQ